MKRKWYRYNPDKHKKQYYVFNIRIGAVAKDPVDTLIMVNPRNMFGIIMNGYNYKFEIYLYLFGKFNFTIYLWGWLDFFAYTKG